MVLVTLHTLILDWNISDVATGVQVVQTPLAKFIDINMYFLFWLKIKFFKFIFLDLVTVQYIDIP